MSVVFFFSFFWDLKHKLLVINVTLFNHSYLPMTTGLLTSPSFNCPRVGWNVGFFHHPSETVRHMTTMAMWKMNFPPNILPNVLPELGAKLCLAWWDAFPYEMKVCLLDQSYVRPSPSHQQQMSHGLTLIHRMTVFLSKRFFPFKAIFLWVKYLHSITFYQPETTANQIVINILYSFPLEDEGNE